MISKETAMDIALAYREIEVGTKLLADVKEAMDRFSHKDIRDVFGRLTNGLQLGIPAGDTSTRMFHVPYQLAIPIIEASIAQSRAEIAILTEKAKIEIGSVEDATNG